MTAKMTPLTQVLQHVQYRCIERQVISTFRTRPSGIQDQWQKQHGHFVASPLLLRNFSTTRVFELGVSAAGRGEKLKHDGSLDRKIGQAIELQTRTPWHKDGADQPPAQRLRSAGAMTKGMSY
jgi:calcium uniporter protein, mitochondrial